MNKELFRLILVIVLAGIGGARGEVADAPLSNVPAPKPPLIARTAEQSSWLIVITPVQIDAGATSSARKSIRAQLWTKSGTAMQCANQWSDGTQTEDTVVGTTKYSQSPDGKGIHLYSPRLDPRYHDFSKGDFEMLDWITPQNYVGAVTHAGEQCYLYQTKGSAAFAAGSTSLAELNTPAIPTSVYVSMRTGLPVEIDDTSDKYAFQFGSPGELRLPEIRPPAPPPPAPVTPPPTKPKPKKASPSTTKAAKKLDATEKKNAPDGNSD
jgi:hypothetical protein